MEYISSTITNTNNYNNDDNMDIKIETLVIQKMNVSVSKTRHFITNNNTVPEGIILGNELMELLYLDEVKPEEPSHMQVVQLSS